MANILRQPCDEGVIASGVAAARCTKASAPWILAAGLVMAHVFNNRFDQRLSGIRVSIEVEHALDAQRLKLAGAVVPDDLDPGVRTALRQAIVESFISGFRKVMTVAMVLAFLSAIVAWLLISGRTTQFPPC